MVFPLYSTNVGEALGLCEALEWMADLGFDSMIFSLYSKVVVDAFNGDNLYYI